MANHVHLLIQPLQPLSEITRSVKSSSARVANQILNRAGSRFWQVESYDHWVRNQREFDRIKRYIEQNPVKAGLSVRAEDWRWSSAWEAGQVQAGACVTPA
jgi:putative DNA methylase